MQEQTHRTRCEVYSRVVGFLTPVSQWNKGKKEEFRDRKTFSIAPAQK
ncbi:MAG: anaerobic ribonucleoside-triphosphate reductase [Pyramidobacter sp.]|nr:anaerobic ribonucleoside-triphosphate reductase [Pyramidobacter sp.]